MYGDHVYILLMFRINVFTVYGDHVYILLIHIQNVFTPCGDHFHFCPFILPLQIPCSFIPLLILLSSRSRLFSKTKHLLTKYNKWLAYITYCLLHVIDGTMSHWDFLFLCKYSAPPPLYILVDIYFLASCSCVMSAEVHAHSWTKRKPVFFFFSKQVCPVSLIYDLQ